MKIDAIAAHRHKSINTLKSQLTSVYRKTDTRKATELTKLLYTGPASTLAGWKKVVCKKPEAPNASDSKRLTRRRDKNILLADARVLSYAQYGDALGFPVILCHGGYGCRLQRHPDDRNTVSQNVRLIVPDRPGYGDSCPVEHYSFVQWCGDIVQLLEKLAINRFGIIGVGIGSAYALALVDAFKAQQCQTVLLNPIAPFAEIEEYTGILPHEKITYLLARYAPNLFKDMVRLAGKGLKGQAEWYYDNHRRNAIEKDQCLLNNPRFTQHLTEMLIESQKRESQGFIRDMLLLTRDDWEFDLGSTTSSVYIWHSEHNSATPLSMSKRLHHLLRNSRLRIFPDEGNYLMYSQWRSLLNLAAKRADHQVS